MIQDYSILRSMLSGICIGLGSAIFAKLGGIAGAVMFSFGLLTIIHYKLPLYTGIAGFMSPLSWKDWVKMLIILLANVAGCFLIPLLEDIGSIQESANAIIASRIEAGYLDSFLRAIGCGIIMTLIVKAAREKNIILILFGIPLFILLGFYHSIADAGYAAIAIKDTSLVITYIPYWIMIVLGNYVGCNIPRMLNYIK